MKPAASTKIVDQPARLVSHAHWTVWNQCMTHYHFKVSTTSTLKSDWLVVAGVGKKTRLPRCG